MKKLQLKSDSLNAKLIALWAVSESALGGLLHAVKIPFSGLFLGGFAVIIITYIAQANTKNTFSTILKATLLVILIKAIASPHSPPMAYIAVMFQGLIGAITFSTFKVNRFSAICFGAIALVESAFQKILTLTIIFGETLWESIQKFFEGLQGKLNMDWIAELPWLFLTIYGVLYLMVGIIAGNFAFLLPQKVIENTKTIKAAGVKETYDARFVKRRGRKRLWMIVSLLLFATMVFLISGMTNKALYIILRTFGAIVFFLFVFNPLFKYLMQKWVNKSKRKNQDNLKLILELMPDIKSNINLAQQLSASEKGVYKRAKLFVINWLSLTLHNKNEP